MAALLADGGVLLKLRAYVAGAGSLEELEAAGEAHRSSGEVQTQAVTGQIFTGVNQVIGFMQHGDRCAAAGLVEALDRCRAATDVAQALHLNEGGDDRFVIGWTYRGCKT